jgi:hypothetical protein
MTETAYRRAPTALWRTTLSGVIILDKQSECPFRLNGTGADVWALLDQPRTLATLANELSDRFGSPVEQVSEAVEPLLTQLLSARAIEIAELAE